ncbi:MAG: asparagine synthase (glutamine-hydrolyzing) [Prosthecobacter sp.]
MCGIAGAFDQRGRPLEAGMLERMAAEIVHRGPDDEGFFLSPSAGLAFRRLSIIDLAGGHQPIGNETGDVQVILNGEIYNYRELAAELQQAGHVFTTKSDTEVVVHGYEQWGDEVFTRLHGMFGIAILDLRRNRLVLARDRFGIKPVYWLEQDGRVLFGSEIKSILACPGVERRVNWQAVGEYLALRYPLGPETMFDGIQRLSPATLLVADAAGVSERCYWRMPEGGAVIDSMEEAEREVEKALREAVSSHLVSDVPLGLFLSGGVDSTAVLAFMSELSTSPVKTFTANLGDNEATDVASARAAAAHFGAEHHEIKIDPADISLMEQLVWHLDQPISDPAILPTYLLSKAARKEVTVVLTGEGSDETNAGYRSYLRFAAYQQKKNLLALLAPAWPVLRHVPGVGGRLQRLMPLALASNEAQRWINGACDATCVSMLSPRTRPALGRMEGKVDAWLKYASSDEPLERMQHLDRLSWMGECTLMKADRMTMAAGLEARVPFLDHTLAEVAARVHPALRLQGGETKAVLRRILHKRLPAAALRPQSGFVLPLAQWFRGSDFQRWVSQTLSLENLARREATDPVRARALVDNYLATGENTNLVWRLLCLELWFRRFID